MPAGDYLRELDALSAGAEPVRVVYASSRFLSQPSMRDRPLIVFDSSFNPPTFAHLALVNSTIGNPAIAGAAPAHVLLLLAVQNADKPAVPAPMEDRLAMLEAFSHEIRGDGAGVNVAVAITKYPRFVDKARAVFEQFPLVREQVYLTGYDTLIRLLDAKYYPGQTLEQALGGFMARCKIACFIRDNPKWGTADEQRRFVDGIRNGERRDVIPPAWADRIVLLSYDTAQGTRTTAELAIVSSTAARDAAAKGRSAEGLALSDVVSPHVRAYIVQHSLYR